jgi:hypothetical protein
MHWDYTKRTVDNSMPSYVAKAIRRFNHAMPSTSQPSPHFCATPQYGAKVQLIAPMDECPRLTPAQITHLQQEIGTLLYYAWAVDSTMLVTLGCHNGQTTALAPIARTYPNAKVCFSASPMILTIHSDASYLSESHARSRAGVIFYLISKHAPAHLAPTNDSVHITQVIIKHVMSSAAEAELAALFYIAQDACSIRFTLEELGRPQPPTAIQTDNICAKDIANDTVKQRQSRAMDMRF